MDSSNTIPVKIKTKITAASTVLHLTNHPVKLIVKANLSDAIDVWVPKGVHVKLMPPMPISGLPAEMPPEGFLEREFR